MIDPVDERGTKTHRGQSVPHETPDPEIRWHMGLPRGKHSQRHRADTTFSPMNRPETPHVRSLSITAWKTFNRRPAIANLKSLENPRIFNLQT